jgi:hypothetical protein
VRGGRSDLLVFARDGSRFVIETKIWRGSDSFDTGVTELTEYVAGEGDDGKLLGAMLVMFDPTRKVASADYVKSKAADLKAMGVDVRVLTISIFQRAPSHEHRK